jgi:Spy/CpxP family protein refolding chaperone
VSRPTLAPGPEGSKGLDLAAVGALLVALKGSVEVATQVVSAVRSWMNRTKGSTQTLKLTMNGQTLELSAATTDQQQQLVDAFVAAAATPQQT